MINPKAIINYNRTPDELLEFACFCVVVAGKNSHQQAAKLAELFNHPLMTLHSQLSLMTATKENMIAHLKRVRMGQYERISHAFKKLYELSMTKGLDKCSLEDLASIKGIGPKTARFFLMFSRPAQRYAILDTHLLKFCREVLGLQGIPKATPAKSKYEELERAYIAYLDGLGVKDFAAFDLAKWSESTKG